jgi:uncharacterized protein YabN with tetrapyrrole methylase and pyrophosphatase domain
MNVLERLDQLEQEADDYGFTWPDASTILKQVISECQEIQQALHQGESPSRLQEEIGDLIHAAYSLCWFNGFDLVQTTELATDKFSARLEKVKDLAQAEGLASLKGQPFEVLMAYWDRAKG